MAPSTSGLGARSEPMASIAITTDVGAISSSGAKAARASSSSLSPTTRENRGLRWLRSDRKWRPFSATWIRLPLLRAPYSNRTWGRHDAAFCARGNSDTRRASARSGNHGRAAWMCALWSVAVLDWALLTSEFYFGRDAACHVSLQLLLDLVQRCPARIRHRRSAITEL